MKEYAKFLVKGFDAHSKVLSIEKNVIKQGHDNKPVKSAGSCVDLDQ